MPKNKVIISFGPALGLVFLLLANAAHGQVYGCKDPLSANYNPAATVNDGSCTYTPTAYTPPVKVDPLSDTLVETSGLQMAGNFLWSFNDGGGAAAIYRMDTLTKNLLQQVNLAGAVNVDWEDIAFDGTFFYVGDFGNNANGARTDLKIYKFPLSAIPDYNITPVATIPAGLITTINFSYGDQPQPPTPTSNNSTKFDCEAMIVEDEKIHLFSKNWVDLNTTHYEINGITAGTYIAAPLETLATNYLVTAADKGNGKKVVILLGYKIVAPANHYMYLLTDYSGGKYFNGNKRQIDLPNVTVMGQAEGITFRTGTYGYISNERYTYLSFFTITQKLRFFDISSYIPAVASVYSFTGSGNWEDAGNWNNNTIPPASIMQGSEIIIDPLAGGACSLNTVYNLSPGTKFTVATGKAFVIHGSLNLTK